MEVSELLLNQEPPQPFQSTKTGTNTRARKCSMDHFSNKLLVDRNGNTCASTIKRLASLSEDVDEIMHKQEGETSEICDNNKDESWRKTLINQIQNLLQDVNLSQTNPDKVYDDLIDKALNNKSLNNNATRNRRSSSFALSAPGTNQNRRCSVATAKTLQNNAQSRGRRMSYASITSPAMPKTGRRSSVAILPTNGRRLSCTNNNFLPNPATFLRQRRKSSAKPMTVSVIKASSVQKQLHKIYKKRRRKERASINLAELRSALRGPDYEDNSDKELDDIDKENSVDDNSNTEVWEDVPDCAGGEMDAGIDVKPDDTQDIAEGEVIPVVRRKDSTQIRAWELSHRRRRGRRQVSANF